MPTFLVSGYDSQCWKFLSLFRERDCRSCIKIVMTHDHWHRFIGRERRHFYFGVGQGLILKWASDSSEVVKHCHFVFIKQTAFGQRTWRECPISCFFYFKLHEYKNVGNENKTKIILFARIKKAKISANKMDRAV